MTDARPAVGFPAVAWGPSGSRVSRVGARFAATTLGSWLIRTAVPLDRWVLVKSGGRRTVLGPMGATLLLLTTTGSVSGTARTTPLMYLPDGDAILLAGSNFGQSRHPAWSTNLLKDPEAVVTIGGIDYPVTARLLEGDERAAGWAKFTAAAVTYRAYLERTDRTIRVFSLARKAAR